MNAPVKVEAAARPTTLAGALIAAQAELHAPAKNRTVNVPGKYKFDYATLDEITERVLRPVLPAHGLWFTQGVRDGNMVTTIVHESGQELEAGHLPMPPITNGRPQEAGSLITYFKRYSLCAAFGLVADEDDDGTAASGEKFETAERRPQNGAAKPAQPKADLPFPPGPAKNRTDLKTRLRDVWRDVEGSGDEDSLDIVLDTNRELLAQGRKCLADWFSGFERDGTSYEGFDQLVERRRSDLANEAWKNNPVSAG